MNVPGRRCVRKQIELSPKEAVGGYVVPCSINRLTTDSQFFVLADIKVHSAAFILAKIEQQSKLSKLKLIGRLENLDVLLEREDTTHPLEDIAD